MSTSAVHSGSSSTGLPNVGAAALELDMAGVIRSADGGLRALLGAAAEDLCGRPLVEFVHSEHRPAVRAALSGCIDAGQPCTIDCRVGGDREALRWVELSLSRAAAGIAVSLCDATRARAAERAAREAQALLSAFVAHAPAAISVRDVSGRLLSVSPEFARIVGSHPALLAGRGDVRLYPDDDFEQQALSQARAVHQDVAITLPDGQQRTYADLRFPVFGPDGRPTAVGQIATDVTDLRAAELAHYVGDGGAADERYRLLAEHSLDVIARMRPDGTFSYVSPAARNVLGYAPEELTGPRPPDGRVHPEDEAAVADAISRVIGGGPAKTLAYRFLHGNGSWRWLETTWSCIRTADGAAVRAVDPTRNVPAVRFELFATTRDVSDRYAAQLQLEQLALRDGLTGLANRALLSDRLTTAIERLERRGGAVAVYLIDLDHFKRINDTFGHAGGDAVIVEAGRRLTRASRAGDTVARLGGDELILVAEVAGRAEAEALGARLLEQLRKPYPEPVGRVCTASIGLALGRDYRCDPDALLQRADVALYAAKQAGRDRMEVFAGAVQRRLGRRRAVEQQVRNALADGGLQLDYQPLADLDTGLVVAAEALARLDSPDGLPVAPDIFIGVAEETGLIAELDRWVIRDVIRQGRQLRSSGIGRCPVFSVNVSARTIASPEFADWLAGELDAADLDGAGLSLELTERTLLVAGETVERTLASLAEMGVGVGLDDFGTGWSSLRYLSELSLDFVKLDRAFTAELIPGGRKFDFAVAICGLARSLGLAVVAEGIESKAQVEQLRAAGCDLGQGFALARPMQLGLLPKAIDLLTAD